MTSLPLLAHNSPHSIVAYRTDGAVTRQQFLSEVYQLAALFPAGSHLLNLCRDRYRFSVGLAAAIVSGKVSLLPPTQTTEVLRQIKLFAPDVFVLTDNDLCTVNMPQLRYPPMNASAPEIIDVPQIASTQRIAVVFTSGSTGIPQPHQKTWGALVHSVQSEALRLELTPDCTLVGTVPPQHMYGFESTLLMAWCSGAAFSHTQPFYPADICQALLAAPMPRILISSPLHLRAWLDAQLPLPELAGVVSATALMPAQLALDIETRCNTRLYEIYGCTETGQIATRRPTQDATWHLFPGMKLNVVDDCIHACGEHVEASIAVNDRIELLTDELFLLHGRMTDMVNIAGKRHSLASLDHLLNTLPGVLDGAFYMPDDSAQVMRLAAVVVAPGVPPSALLEALREHLDPVFLPRPLLLVESLPRNSTGKLPRSALQALLKART